MGGHRLHDRLEAMDPAAASKIEATNVRRTVRALEVAAVTGRPFSEFAAAWDAFPPGRVRAAGIEMPRAVSAARIAARVRVMIDRGWLDEVRRPGATGGSAAGSPPLRPSVTLSSPLTCREP